MDNKKKFQKKVPKFFCASCDYSSSRESQWKRHLETEKHKRITMDNKKVPKSKKTKKIGKNVCVCGKTYKFKSGLCKHRKKCQIALDNDKVSVVQSEHKQEIVLEEKSEELNTDLKEIFKAFMKSQTEFNKKIAEEIAKPQTVYNDCHNNKMTINVFLNESCKDAMNLTDFVENLQITLDDLKFTKDNGYVEGVTNIFTKQLKDMKPTDRPIHCSDKKRLEFYVKDDNKWEKDKGNKKIDQTLTNIKLKQTMKIGDWEKLHPNYREDPELLDEWQNMLAGITEDTEGNVLKQKLSLKRKIANYIELKDAMEKNK